MKQQIIIIAGPTASGKTSFSVDVAKAVDGEIISADSMQIYEHFDIGTAKVTKEEMQGIQHYMISFCKLNSEYSVSEFVEAVHNLIEQIGSRNKVPIIVGGTGLFIEGLLYPYTFASASKDETIRNKYKEILETQGVDYLYNLLVKCVPERAKFLHKNDTKRVIRALEVNELGGCQQQNVIKESKYDFTYICLDMPRDVLYERINKRVDIMLEQGVQKEIEDLLHMGAKWDSQAMQGIGYKEWKPYFEGSATKEQVIEKIKQNSRNYAKRQLTWFRHRQDVTWVKLEERNKTIQNLEEKYKRR